MNHGKVVNLGRVGTCGHRHCCANDAPATYHFHPHSLGEVEAIRRLKSGLAAAQSQFRQLFTVQEEIWSGDQVALRVAALGQTASGTIDVGEDHVRFEVVLPWLLAKVAEQIQQVVNAQGTIMLEKKRTLVVA
jgi:hypothetical protein